MSRPTFWREASVALALSIVGAIAFHATAALIGSSMALRLLIAASGVVYALLLMRGLRARSGRLIAIAAWLALDIALFVFQPPLLLWLLGQVFAIWLLRCWCCYGSFVAALADGVLCLFAVAAAIAGAAQSHSVFLALWSFFLVQALFVLIPETLRPCLAATFPDDTDHFDQAHRSAEAALRRLTART
jgi:hypothetical protein